MRDTLLRPSRPATFAALTAAMRVEARSAQPPRPPAAARNEAPLAERLLSDLAVDLRRLADARPQPRPTLSARYSRFAEAVGEHVARLPRPQLRRRGRQLAATAATASRSVWSTRVQPQSVALAITTQRLAGRAVKVSRRTINHVAEGVALALSFAAAAIHDLRLPAS